MPVCPHARLVTLAHLVTVLMKAETDMTAERIVCLRYILSQHKAMLVYSLLVTLCLILMGGASSRYTAPQCAQSIYMAPYMVEAAAAPTTDTALHTKRGKVFPGRRGSSLSSLCKKICFSILRHLSRLLLRYGVRAVRARLINIMNESNQRNSTGTTWLNGLFSQTYTTKGETGSLQD